MSADAAVTRLHLAPPVDELEAAIEDFRRSMVARGLSAGSTIHDRIGFIRTFARATGVSPLTADVDDIIGYLAREDLTAWSRATYFAHLRSWFSWLHKRGLRADDPMTAIGRPQKGRSAPRPLSDAEVDALFAAASPRMRTWLTLGLFAGLRAHEIAKIRGLDVQQETLFVLGKGNRGAELPTHPAVWEEAQKFGSGFWFPSTGRSGHINSATVSHTSSLFFTKVGVEGAIHRCRHTYATRLLRLGVNVRVVQQMMRHESLETTARYTAVYEVDMRDAVMRLAGPSDVGTGGDSHD